LEKGNQEKMERNKETRVEAEGTENDDDIFGDPDEVKEHFSKPVEIHETGLA
jgi:hypothetical protein